MKYIYIIHILQHVCTAFIIHIYIYKRANKWTKEKGKLMNQGVLLTVITVWSLTPYSKDQKKEKMKTQTSPTPKKRWKHKHSPFQTRKRKKKKKRWQYKHPPFQRKKRKDDNIPPPPPPHSKERRKDDNINTPPFQRKHENIKTTNKQKEILKVSNKSRTHYCQLHSASK